MAFYEIVAVETETPREWSANGNPMHAWRVKLKNEQGNELGNVEVNKKPGNNPQVGAKLEGEVDTSGQYGPKFKAAKKNFGGGGGGGGGRASSPEERASIQAQTATKVAGEIVCALIAKDAITTVEPSQAALTSLTGVAMAAIKAGQ